LATFSPQEGRRDGRHLRFVREVLDVSGLESLMDSCEALSPVYRNLRQWTEKAPGAA
jgi:hypothetical protein